MENSIKIIMFENNENHETWLHANIPVTVMYFSKGFNDDPDFTIELTHEGAWQFDGVTFEDPIDKDDFEILWNQGINFKNNPERVLKQQQKKSLQKQIEKTEELLKDYKNKLEKI